MKNRFSICLLSVLFALTAGDRLLAASVESAFKPKLLQVKLSASDVPAGGSLHVTCWWQNAGERPADDDEIIFIHVRRQGETENAPGAIRLGADHRPAIPMYRWRSNRIVSDSAPIKVPDDTPPGDYVLLLGIYNQETGSRRTLDLPLPANEKARRYLVAKFHILPVDGKSDAAPLVNSFAPMPSAASVRAPKPDTTVTIGKGPLTLVMDAAEPRVAAWRLGDTELAGDPEGEEPTVRILSVADNRVRPADAKPFQTTWTLRQKKKSVIYRAEISESGKPSVSFELGFTVTGDRAEVALERVTEAEGYQLVSVRLSRLVAACEGARLALPFNAGRLIDPALSAPAEKAFQIDWITQVLAGVVYDRAMLCAAGLEGVDARLVATVGENWTALGASFEHRAPAKKSMPSLLLSDRSVIRLRFFKPEKGEPNWMDGTRLLRAEVKARPPAFYDHTFIYKIFCDSPGAKQFVTFEQAADMVRKISLLTDGAPQVGYLVGWQHQGHDTGYPDVFTVNPRLGGLDGLKTAIKRAADCNAVLSFHDNFDDAYTNSPAWAPEFIARSSDGELMKGGVWAGGQSYVMSFFKYGTGPARERVRRTLAMVPIRRSYHIDVLSAVPLRRDFNPANPASGEKSLQGKIAIVREFNKRGVDVTSEGFSAPFVGVQGHAWHLMRRRETLFAGEERIPFVPFIYHNRATYGGGRISDLSDTLLYGAAQSGDFSGGTPLSEITDRYYLIEVPWFLFRYSEMTGYTAAGGIRRVNYGPDSFIEVTDDNQHYRVVKNGRPMVVDGNVFVPNWRDDAWLAYSRTGGHLNFPAPKGWSDAAKVSAITLTADGPGAAVSVILDNGRVCIDMSPATPVRIQYGQ